MKHNKFNRGILKAYLDGEADAAGISATDQQAMKDHIEACGDCGVELKTLADRAASVSEALEDLPLYPGNATATAWAAFQQKREQPGDMIARREGRLAQWSPLKWSLAGGGFAVATVALLLTLAPVRAWAESLLSVFRVEHFTVLEVNSNMANGLQNNQLMNKAVTHILSDEVTVTQQPQQPQLVADAATASTLAGFPVKLLADQTPAALLFESGFGAQAKLDRDRLQAIFNEAGRDDLRIPRSVDGAIIGVRIPAGIAARYGHCGDVPAGVDAKKAASADPASVIPSDATCITLVELRSPIVSAPRELDPAQIAQVALQFMGMSANDAASFTQTVDWTSTLVLPVINGESSYRQVHIDGNEGVLLRSKRAPAGSGFTLMWVDNGIVYSLEATGDDTTAINLAEQLQ